MATEKERQGTPTASPPSPSTDLPANGAMSYLGAVWVETLGKMGTEIATFVSDRIREDVRTQHEILHCRDLREMQGIQARFVQRAVDQYVAETGKLVEIQREMMEAMQQAPRAGDRS